MPIAIYDKVANARLFEVTDAQRDQLVAALEEEDEADRDYYVDAAVCDFLDGRVDADVIAKLRDALKASGKAPVSPTGAGAEAMGEDDELPEVGAGEDLEEDGIEIEWREE